MSPLTGGAMCSRVFLKPHIAKEKREPMKYSLVNFWKKKWHFWSQTLCVARLFLFLALFKPFLPLFGPCLALWPKAQRTEGIESLKFIECFKPINEI